MKTENEYALEKLENAYLRLKEGVEEAEDELDVDGALQRFEFTFELLWKTLKVFLREKGVEAVTPRDALKEAFRLEWLNDEETFLSMLKDRNVTSHIYDENTSREIFDRVSKDYVSAIDGVIQKLKSL